MPSDEMGRAKGLSAEGLKTAAEVACHLLETCPSLREFDAYIFGSSLYGVGSDYDVLIVGPSGEPLACLKEELKVAGAEIPLDVLCMLPEEAEFTDFVTREGCIPLSQVASCGRRLLPDQSD